jgi:hypothetical protein
MGRPSKNLESMEFDGWDQLDALIVWASQEYCCEKLGVNTDTLTKKIKEKHGCSFSEYKIKRQEPMRINLLKKQYDVAMAGNVSMLIWLGKNILGQSDKIENKTVEVSKEDTKILIKEAQELVEKMQ